MVRPFSSRAHTVRIFLTAQTGCAKAGADLDALYGVDAHHRRCKLAIELGIKRRAPTGGNARGNAFDNRAKRGARLACLIYHFFPTTGGGFIRAKEGVFTNLRCFKIIAINRIATDFSDIGHDFHIRYDGTRHCASRHARGGFARA